MNRAAVLLLLAGCAAGGSPAASAPARVWAVVPVAGAVNGAGFADLLASALVRTGAGKVHRPRPPLPTSAADATAAARRLGAEAVLAVAVLEHDPYEPPKTVVRVQVLRSRATPLSGSDLERLVSSPSWRGAPLPMGGAEGHAALAYDEVFDARDAALREALRAYAAVRAGDNGFIAEREFLAVQSRWLEFVAARIAERAVAGR